jgi:hypothetical protein
MKSVSELLLPQLGNFKTGPTTDITGFVVMLPERGSSGSPGRSAAAAVATITKANPGVSVDEAERTAMLDDPTRGWVGVRFDDSPIPPTATVTSAREVDSAGKSVVQTFTKEVRDRPNYGLCRKERIKGDTLLPADKPTVFSSAEAAATCVDRHRRLGLQQDLPDASYLKFAQVASHAEFKAITEGVHSELQQTDREDALARAEREAAEAAQRLEQAREALGYKAPAPTAPTPAAPAPTNQWSADVVDGAKLTGIQWRSTAQGTRFRKRIDGHSSPSLDTLAAAQAWDPQA